MASQQELYEYVGIFTLAETDIMKDDKQGVGIAIGDNL